MDGTCRAKYRTRLGGIGRVSFKVGDWVYVDVPLGRLLPGWTYKITKVDPWHGEWIRVYLPVQGVESGNVFSLHKVHHLVERSTPEDWEAMVG
jgi:hypothetical protein